MLILTLGCRDATEIATPIAAVTALRIGAMTGATKTSIGLQEGSVPENAVVQESASLLRNIVLTVDGGDLAAIET
jgi:hypothetical protein